MTAPAAADIAKDLAELQEPIRDLERSHKNRFAAVFVENTLSRIIVR